MVVEEIKNGPNRYSVHGHVANGVGYRLYLCTQKEVADLPKRSCLLQVANTVGDNGKLDRVAYLLRELKFRSDELEEAYEKVKKDPRVMMNYDLGFPQLIDSFLCENQGGRRINILGFRNVDDVGSLMPLAYITQKHQCRVDIKTSAWILGKALKLLVFTHDQLISLRLLSGKNILIQPDEHYVMILDCSAAKIYFEEMPEEIRRREIQQVAHSVANVLGRDLKTGTFPNDGEEGFKQYTQFVLRLAREGESSASRAHRNFYDLVDSLWERKFHPFTVKPLN